MARTFLWHDYETFGVNPRFDRPAQFAGIRTDEAFQVIGEPVEFFCRPIDDVLPQPEACLITGITPQMAEERGVDEPQFIAEVLKVLAEPGTCGVGYNSFRFDDEVTRHALWRNFHEPYAREYKNGCSRWDLIDTVRLTYALRPDGINWPQREDGKPSFRLEQLATANGLAQERAHDALSDVHATIELAQLVRSKQPKLFDWVLANRGKPAVWAMLDLKDPKPVVHVSEKFPAENGCLSLVLPITMQPGNSNSVLAYDLRHAPDDLLELDAEDIAERIFTPAADMPEGVQRIPVKAIHVNRAPVLAPLRTVAAAQAQRLNLDLAAAERHAQTLIRHLPAVAAKLAAAYASNEFGDNSDPEQNLYGGGFLDDSDRGLCQQIIQATRSELAELQPGFHDKRLDELWFRYRGRYLPETLEDGERDEWQNWRRKRIDYAPDGGLALDEYRALLSELDKTRTSVDDQRILAELKAWGESL